MDDLRYRLLPSDAKAKGDYMVVREIIRDVDGKVMRDRDFNPEYFHVHTAAYQRTDDLNKKLIENG